MKRCPECRRDYYDDTLLYCFDDGNALLEGPASAGSSLTEEPRAAILYDTATPSEAGKERLIDNIQQRAENGNFWLFLIRTDPTYDSSRGDPRFQEIAKRFDPPQ
jgi:hypothetical protein